MRRLGSFLFLAATACGTNLGLPTNVIVTCGERSECPSGLVCVSGLNRCVTPGTACVADVGGRFVPAADGNVCDRGSGGQGTCRGGLCLNICGDGFLDPGVEPCDDGNSNNADACTNTCALNVCGDRFVNAGVEECDDGNDDPNDGCHQCALAVWDATLVVEANELPGSPLSLGLSRPVGLAHDGAGNLYFADADRRVIYKRDVATSLITAIAGTGDTRAGAFYPGIAPTQLSLASTSGVAAAADGTLFFSESSAARARIYRIRPNGDFEVFAGSGPRCNVASDPTCGNDGLAAYAALLGPGALAWDEPSQRLYFVDGRTVRVVAGGYVYHVVGDGRDCLGGSCPDCPRDGIGQVSAACGDGAPATDAPVMRISHVAVDPDGALYYSDAAMHRVRRVDPVTGNLQTVVGTGALCATDPFPQACGDGAPGIEARLNSPAGIVAGTDGALYIADSEAGGRVRVLRNGTIATHAGQTVSCFVDGNCLSADGPRLTTQFFRLEALSFDPTGRLHLIDELNRIVRVIDGDTVTTEIGNRTPLTNPEGREAIGANLAVSMTAADSAGNLYVLVSGFIFRVDAVTGLIDHIAGIGVGSDGFACDAGSCGTDGPAVQAFLGFISDIAVLDSGQVFIAESVISRVRRIDADGIIRNVATGVGVTGIDVSAGCKLYLTNGNTIGLVTNACTTPSAVTSVAGTGDWGLGTENGSATTRLLACPSDVAVDPMNDSNFVIADLDNCKVRRVAAGNMTTLVTGTNSDCTRPPTEPDGSTPQGGCGEWVQGLGTPPALPFVIPFSVRYASDGTLYIRDYARIATLRRTAAGALTNYFPAPQTFNDNLDHDAGDLGPFTSATFNSVQNVSHDPHGNTYVATFGGRSGRVRRIDASSSIITTIVGADLGTTGSFELATLGNAVEATILDGALLVASGSMGRVRRASFADQRVAVVAGYQGGTASSSTPVNARYSELFGNAAGIAFDATGRDFFVSDETNNLIRAIDATSAEPAEWTNVLYAGRLDYGFVDGPGVIARFSHPAGLAFDPAARRLYVADTSNQVVRAIAVDDPAHTVTTVAGTPAFEGDSGDDGPAVQARLSNPRRLAVAGDGALYIADSGNRRIRRVGNDNVITTVFDYGDPVRVLGDDGTRVDITDVRGLMVDSRSNLWIAAGAYVLVLGGDGDQSPTGGLPALIYGADRSAPPESITACIAALAEDGSTILAADACAGVLVRLSRAQ